MLLKSMRIPEEELRDPEDKRYCTWLRSTISFSHSTNQRGLVLGPGEAAVNKTLSSRAPSLEGKTDEGRGTNPSSQAAELW